MHRSNRFLYSLTFSSALAALAFVAIMFADRAVAKDIRVGDRYSRYFWLMSASLPSTPFVHDSKSKLRVRTEDTHNQHVNMVKPWCS